MEWWLRVAAFVVTWLVAGVIFGNLVGRAGSAWGPDDEEPK